jgi:MFS family permease
LRDLAAGFSLVRHAPALSTVLITWPIVNIATAGVNVAEVVLAKHVFNAGDIGFGVLVGASGLGLAVGSFFTARLTQRVGLARAYGGGIALMGVGAGLAALSPNVWVAAVCVVVGGGGNGVAVVSNFLLIGRGAPDELRGRAVTVLMSVGSISMLLAMVVAGQLTDVVGARWVWGAAGLTGLAGAAVGLQKARRIPALGAAASHDGRSTPE